jgi:hypothetical protein
MRAGWRRVVEDAFEQNKAVARLAVVGEVPPSLGAIHIMVSRFRGDTAALGVTATVQKKMITIPILVSDWGGGVIA